MDYTFLHEFMLPVCICVLLPVSVVWIVVSFRRHAIDKKAEIVSKCVESGIEVDPAIFAERRRTRTLKTRLLGMLGFGVALLIIGASLAAAVFVSGLELLSVTGYCAIGALAAGAGLLVWYLVGRKLLAEDILREQEELKTSGK